MGRGSDGPGAPGAPGLAPELAAHREKTVALIAEWYKADRCAPPAAGTSTSKPRLDSSR